MSSVIKKRFAKLIIWTGLLLIGMTVLPIAWHQVVYVLTAPPEIADPSGSAYPRPIVLNVLGVSDTDYTEASAWFTNASPPAAVNPPAHAKYFTVSMPRLGINNVTVEVYGSDLKKNAIQYPGTALPGTPGNPVIFGHSSLPQLYRAGNPLTIFNPLPKAKIGDDVIVNYDGITYRYQVKSTEEVHPTDIRVLAQRLNKYEITLVTCVPLGTYWSRFVAVAELVT